MKTIVWFLHYGKVKPADPSVSRSLGGVDGNAEELVERLRTAGWPAIIGTADVVPSASDIPPLPIRSAF